MLLLSALILADVCAYQTEFENMKVDASSFFAALSPSYFTQPCLVFIYKYLEDLFLTYPSWDPRLVYNAIASVLDMTNKCDFVEIQGSLGVAPFALSGLALATKLNVDWQEPLQRFTLFINATRQYFGWDWITLSSTYSLWLVKYGTVYKDLFTTLYVLLVMKSLGINVTNYVNKYTPGVTDVVIYSLKYNVGAFTNAQLVTAVPELYVMALKLGFLNLSDVCEITSLILNSRGLDSLYTSTELNYLLASAGVPFWYIIAKKCYDAGLMSANDYIKLVNALDYFTEYHLQKDIDTFVLGDKLRLYMYYAYKCEYANTTWPIDVIFEPSRSGSQPVIVYNITNITSVTSTTVVSQITTIITTTIIYRNTTVITTLSRIITYSYPQPMSVSPIFLLIPAVLGAIRVMSKEDVERPLRRLEG